jgi:hypothetical protein
MFKRSNQKKSKGSKSVHIVADGKSEFSIPNPGGLQATGIPTTSMKLKFNCGTATTSSVTWANLLDTVVFAATSTSVYDLFYSARLHSVEVWLPPQVAGVATSAQFTLAFDSPSQGDQRVWSCYSGPTGGYLKAKPSNHSINGMMWQNSSSVGCFTVNNCPIGALIQVNVTFRTRMGSGSAIAAAQAASGATAGTVYFRGLDGLAIASTKFPPVPASYAI